MVRVQLKKTYLHFDVVLLLRTIGRFLILITSGVVADDKLQYDVCIIGAGPSGVQAAYSLDKAGYTTAIFEKNDYIGGKTKTITYNGYRYRMGAVLHSGRKAHSLQYLLDKFNITKNKPRSNLLEIDDDGTTRPLQISNPTLAVAAIRRYQLNRLFLQGLDNPNAYSFEKYPTNIHEPFATWLQIKYLTRIKPFFWFWVSVLGYGNMNTIPTMYVMKYIDNGLIDDSLGFVKSTLSQPYFQDLLLAMTESLNYSTTFLNATISNVQYGSPNNNSTIITLSQYNSTLISRNVTCGAMIVAFPPLTSRITQFVPPTIASDLTKLTDQIKIIDYYSLLYDHPSYARFAVNESSYFLRPRTSGPIPEKNIFYITQYPNKTSSVVTVYYLSETSKNDSEIQQLSLASFQAFTGNASIDRTSIKSFNKWDYFPHVTTDSLKNGFYKKFNQLQGKSNQYYTGGLFTFESVQDSMAHGKYIIKKYFPKKE